MTNREALAHHNPGQPVRNDVWIVARVEHSPDYREITIVTTNDLHFPPWQVERALPYKQ